MPPSDATPSTENQGAPLSVPSTLARLAGIGVVILCVVGGFLYLGGWFSPYELTPARFVNGFEKVFGIHSGFRRNHAKGVCVTGFFDSNGQGARLSKAVVFQAGRVPVVGRFSLGGGNPYVSDAPDLIRGMGLLFRLSDGEEWRTAMINRLVFPFNTPQAFYDNLIASQPDPNTHKPDPEKMSAFVASHPEFARAAKIIQGQPPSSGFDNSTFNGLNAFRFINEAGVSTPVRWSMVRTDAFKPEDTAQSANPDKNYLFDDFIARIHSASVQWRLILTVGQPGDPTDDATILWPEDREHVNAGTLTLDEVESEAPGNCRDINFDPLVLPAGITPSDDPLLSARSAVYSQSFTRRAGEKKEPSAITPRDVRK
jgi:catalase